MQKIESIVATKFANLRDRAAMKIGEGFQKRPEETSRQVHDEVSSVMAGIFRLAGTPEDVIDKAFPDAYLVLPHR